MFLRLLIDEDRDIDDYDDVDVDVDVDVVDALDGEVEQALLHHIYIEMVIDKQDGPDSQLVLPLFHRCSEILQSI